MATKDWKREVWGWMNKKNNRHQINMVRRQNGTGVLISIFPDNSDRPRDAKYVANKTFKNKSEAFKYAKSYMMKH